MKYSSAGVLVISWDIKLMKSSETYLQKVWVRHLRPPAGRVMNALSPQNKQKSSFWDRTHSLPILSYPLTPVLLPSDKFQSIAPPAAHNARVQRALPAIYVGVRAWITPYVPVFVVFCVSVYVCDIILINNRPRLFSRSYQFTGEWPVLKYTKSKPTFTRTFVQSVKSYPRFLLTLSDLLEIVRIFYRMRLSLSGSLTNMVAFLLFTSVPA